MNRVILWEPRHGRRSLGRPAKSYINILAADMGAESSEPLGLMGNSFRRRFRSLLPIENLGQAKWETESGGRQ